MSSANRISVDTLMWRRRHVWQASVTHPHCLWEWNMQQHDLWYESLPFAMHTIKCYLQTIREVSYNSWLITKQTEMSGVSQCSLPLTLGLSVDFQEQKATDGVEQWNYNSELYFPHICISLSGGDRSSVCGNTRSPAKTGGFCCSATWQREREGSTPRTSWFPRRREVRCPQNVPRAPIVILSVTTIWNGSLRKNTIFLFLFTTGQLLLLSPKPPGFILSSLNSNRTENKTHKPSLFIFHLPLFWQHSNAGLMKLNP